MYIRNLDTKNKDVTVTLNYDELRCVYNALYEISRFDDIEKDSNFDEVRLKFIELFALVKHGKIPKYELEEMYKLIPRIETL